MRWVEPELGDIRHKTWFAWWPVTIEKECRWLEWVTVEMAYCRTLDLRFIGGGTVEDWKRLRFIDPPKQEPKPQPVVEDVHTRKVDLDDE